MWIALRLAALIVFFVAIVPALGAQGPHKAAESPAELALRWLAAHQEEDGHWDSRKWGAKEKNDTVCTSLALLAFMAAGHSENIGLYQKNVQSGTKWLVGRQEQTGQIGADEKSGESGLSPMALATLALSESVGLSSKSPARESAQKAFDFCIRNWQRRENGWSNGFGPEPGAAASVPHTVWFALALASARRASLGEDAAACQGVYRFLYSVHKPLPGATGPDDCRYEYSLAEAKPERKAELTEMSVLIRLASGADRDQISRSMAWALEDGGLPVWGEKADLASWFIGTEAAFRVGGKTWERWNTSFLDALRKNQCTEGEDTGSWPPVGRYASELGRAGQTALGALCLSVFYEYDRWQFAAAKPPAWTPVETRPALSEADRRALDECIVKLDADQYSERRIAQDQIAGFGFKAQGCLIEESKRILQGAKASFEVRAGLAKALHELECREYEQIAASGKFEFVPPPREMWPKLEVKITFQYNGAPLSEVLEFVHKKSGLRIVLPKEADTFSPIALNVSDMNAETVLKWIGRLDDLLVFVHGDAVFIAPNLAKMKCTMPVWAAPQEAPWSEAELRRFVYTTNSWLASGDAEYYTFPKQAAEIEISPTVICFKGDPSSVNFFDHMMRTMAEPAKPAGELSAAAKDLAAKLDREISFSFRDAPLDLILAAFEKELGVTIKREFKWDPSVGVTLVEDHVSLGVALHRLARNLQLFVVVGTPIMLTSVRQSKWANECRCLDLKPALDAGVPADKLEQAFWTLMAESPYTFRAPCVVRGRCLAPFDEWTEKRANDLIQNSAKLGRVAPLPPARWAP